MDLTGSPIQNNRVTDFGSTCSEYRSSGETSAVRNRFRELDSPVRLKSRSQRVRISEGPVLNNQPLSTGSVIERGVCGPSRKRGYRKARGGVVLSAGLRDQRSLGSHVSTVQIELRTYAGNSQRTGSTSGRLSELLSQSHAGEVKVLKCHVLPVLLTICA